MQALIDVFKMAEVPIETRVKVIQELGVAINHQFGMNVTEELVAELITALRGGSRSNDEVTRLENENEMLRRQIVSITGRPDMDLLIVEALTQET